MSAVAISGAQYNEHYASMHSTVRPNAESRPPTPQLCQPPRVTACQMVRCAANSAALGLFEPTRG